MDRVVRIRFTQEEYKIIDAMEELLGALSLLTTNDNDDTAKRADDLKDDITSFFSCVEDES